MASEFITIKKVVTRKDTTNGIEIDTIRIDDIRNFRKWHKANEYKDIEGDMTLVTIKSTSHPNGVYELKIQETDMSFSERLGRVIPING